jgi:hypothetical protein
MYYEGAAMRKRIIGSSTPPNVPDVQAWIDIERLAYIEVSSETAEHPIEAALRAGLGVGWLAAQPGAQTIRLLFDAPQSLRRIRLVFDEGRRARTQEFVLRWSADGGHSYQEIVRQQYHFSPPGTTQEVEDYTVALDGVNVVELQLVPDISGGDAQASLTALQLA